MFRKTTFSLTAVALLGIATLTGCATGDNAADTDEAAANTAQADTSADTAADGGEASGSGSTGGSYSLKVSGTDITIDDPVVACQEQGGQYALGVVSGSGSATTADGLGAVLSGKDNPTVVSVGVVDSEGNAIAYAEGAGMGSAEVKVDGNTYTITGKGVAANMSDPTSMAETEFEFSITCP
ncbi:lipoprotein LpqH [Gulosibacter hominis]|uniref:lipoprotein LpqH n=1 Tax=Gulosibacter hominis TaxID=2770504 RepID=UPI001918A5E7|nr:lipoprotein LpqH [Gulosibacter hominis]